MYIICTMQAKLRSKHKCLHLMTSLEPSDGERGCGEVGPAVLGGRHQESSPWPAKNGESYG